MGHSQHTDAKGKNIPSVSAIPGIFAKDMSGFQSWICKGLHDSDSVCCARAAKEYYEEAADLGNDVHRLREAFLKNDKFKEVPSYHAALFGPIEKFYKESGYKPLFVEEKMTGKEFGGTLDGAGTFSVPFWEKQRKTFWDSYSIRYGPQGVTCEDVLPDTGSVWIEDLKIKSKIDPLHGLQLYGYSKLLKETKGIQADWGLIIRREKKLEKRPEIQLKGYYLPAFKDFWDASMLMWKFLNE